MMITVDSNNSNTISNTAGNVKLDVERNGKLRVFYLLTPLEKYSCLSQNADSVGLLNPEINSEIEGFQIFKHSGLWARIYQYHRHQYEYAINTFLLKCACRFAGFFSFCESNLSSIFYFQYIMPLFFSIAALFIVCFFIPNIYH